MKKIVLVSAFTFIIDLISKIVVMNSLILNKTFVVIDNFFQLTYTHNYGAAFSILNNRKILLIVIAILMLGYLIWYIYREKPNKKIEIVGYGLILGGIIGNLFDRIVYGYVIDFLDFTIFGYDFAIFNLADVSIVIGIICLIIDCVIRGDKK